MDAAKAGPAVPPGLPTARSVFGAEELAELAQAELSPAGRQAVETALALIDGLAGQIVPLRAQLGDFARRQAGCRALMGLYGVGPLTALIIWGQMGDTWRFSSSRHAVRHTGVDVTVYSSDGKRTRGHLARPRPAGAALGVVRGGPVRGAGQFARP